MRKVLLATCLGATAAFAAGAANANDELIKMSQNPKDWVMPTGDYANQRYSALSQITKDNVKNLQPVWTFSTGVLRGHEGAPLVIGDVMYVHTPFPNYVYALDLTRDGVIDLFDRPAHQVGTDSTVQKHGIVHAGNCRQCAKPLSISAVRVQRFTAFDETRGP